MHRRTVVSTSLACAALAVALLISTATTTAASKHQDIVTLTPFSSNALVNSGLRPVAIGKQAAGSKWMSPKLKGVRQLALSHPNGPNLEEIAQIDPDVVLSSTAWSKGTKTMRDLAITVRVMDPARVSQVVPQIKSIGNAYGNKKKTAAFAKKIQGQIKVGISGRPIKQRPRVLMLLGVGRAPQAFMKSSWGASVVSAAGGRLITQGLKDDGGFAKVADEWIISQDPDVIIVVPHGNANDLDAIADFYRSNPAWSDLSAVKNGAVKIEMNDGLLQPDTDVGNTIKRVRKNLLKNWL